MCGDQRRDQEEEEPVEILGRKFCFNHPILVAIWMLPGPARFHWPWMNESLRLPYILTVNSSLFFLIYQKSRQSTKWYFVTKIFLTYCTEVRFASFLSGGFTTMAVMNPPEKKLEKRTYVHCVKSYDIRRSDYLALDWSGVHVILVSLFVIPIIRSISHFFGRPNFFL